MALSVSIAEARDGLTRLLRRVERGEAVEITRHGRPVAALVSVSEYQRFRHGTPSFSAALERVRRAVSNAELEALSRALVDLRDPTHGRETKL